MAICNIKTIFGTFHTIEILTSSYIYISIFVFADMKLGDSC